MINNTNIDPSWIFFIGKMILISVAFISFAMIANAISNLVSNAIEAKAKQPNVDIGSMFVLGIIALEFPILLTFALVFLQ